MLPSLNGTHAQEDTARTITPLDWRKLTGRAEYQRHRTRPYALPRHTLIVDASGMYDSYQLRNALMRSLWRGGEVTREAREGSQEALDAMNRSGYDLDASIRYEWRPLDDSGRVRDPRFIRIAYHDLMGTRFTEDAYNLTFFGNKAYAGTSADLSGSAYERITYQTFGFGMPIGPMTVELAMVNGQSLDAVDIEYGSLYTAPDGTEIIANIQGDFARSDTSIASTVGLSKGVGAAMALHYPWRVGFFGRSWLVDLSVEDLGFITWNSHSLSLDMEEPVEYTGLEVDDIFDLDGLVLSEGEIRERYGLQEEVGTITRMLPWKVEARFHRRGRKYRRYTTSPVYPATVMLGYRALPGALPYARYTYLKPLSRRWTVGLSAQYGGFGGARFGLVGSGYLGGDLYLTAAVPNIVGLVSEQGRGAALEFALSHAW